MVFLTWEIGRWWIVRAVRTSSCSMFYQWGCNHHPNIWYNSNSKGGRYFRYWYIVRYVNQDGDHYIGRWRPSGDRGHPVEGNNNPLFLRLRLHLRQYLGWQCHRYNYPANVPHSDFKSAFQIPRVVLQGTSYQDPGVAMWLPELTHEARVRSLCKVGAMHFNGSGDRGGLRTPRSTLSGTI